MWLHVSEGGGGWGCFRTILTTKTNKKGLIHLVTRLCVWLQWRRFLSFLGFSCSWRRFLSFLGFSCSGCFFSLSISVGLHCHSLLVNWESQDDIQSPRPPQFACKLGKQDDMQSPKPPQFAWKLGKSTNHVLKNTCQFQSESFIEKPRDMPSWWLLHAC